MRSSPESGPGPEDVTRKMELLPSDGELDAAARRSRRTEIERLSRRRRQATLRAMRDEVRALELKFGALMADHAARKRDEGYVLDTLTDSEEALSIDGDDDDLLSEVKFSEQVKLLRERFIELKLRETDLENEQKELQRSLRGRQLLAMSVQSLAFSSVRLWTNTEEPQDPDDVEYPYRPPEEYTRFMRDAYEELKNLEETTNFEPLGNICMGWSDRRFTDDSKVIFSLTKTFEGREIEPILEESWDVFSSETRLRQSFGSWGSSMKLRIIDRPNEDTLVIHRSVLRNGCKGLLRIHIGFVMFRVKTADGYTLCMRSIPSLQTATLDPSSRWSGIFTWLHFRRTPKGCQVEYNNMMLFRRRQRDLSEMFVTFLSTVIRWEATCVASNLLTVQ